MKTNVTGVFLFLDLDVLIDENLLRNTNGLFSCKICGKDSSTRQNTRNHIETHLALAGFACSTCGKTYRTRNSLNVHKSSMHRSEAVKMDMRNLAMMKSGFTKPM